MTSARVPPNLGDQLSDLVKSIMSEIRPKLIQAALSGNSGESENRRHEDNFLSVHDMWMHDRYRDLLSGMIGSFVYASEEAEPQVVGPDAEPRPVCHCRPTRH
jgi:myo-inositol-1(or 4)-monophosphatase